MTQVCPPLSRALPAVTSSCREGAGQSPAPWSPISCSGPSRIKGPCGTNVLGAGGGPQAAGDGAGPGGDSAGQGVTVQDREKLASKGPGAQLSHAARTPPGRQLPKDCPLFHTTARRQMGSRRQTANIFPNTLAALGVEMTPAYKLGLLGRTAGPQFQEPHLPWPEGDPDVRPVRGGRGEGRSRGTPATGWGILITGLSGFWEEKDRNRTSEAAGCLLEVIARRGQ